MPVRKFSSEGQSVAFVAIVFVLPSVLPPHVHHKQLLPLAWVIDSVFVRCPMWRNFGICGSVIFRLQIDRVGLSWVLQRGRHWMVGLGARGPEIGTWSEEAHGGFQV